MRTSRRPKLRQTPLLHRDAPRRHQGTLRLGVRIWAQVVELQAANGESKGNDKKIDQVHSNPPNC
jgi:hypothetical protein